LDLLNRNLAALGQVNPTLAEWVASQPDEAGLELIRCPDNTPNLMIKIGANKVLAYEMDDPWRLPRLKAEEVDRYQQNLSLVIGLGLGYVVRAIMEIMEKGHCIVVVEPKAQIIRLAFSLHDYTEALASGALTLAGPGEVEITKAMEPVQQLLILGETNLATEEYINYLKPDYQPLADHIYRVATQMRGNLATVSAKGAEIITNEIRSLPFVIRARGVAELAGVFKGKPAILVSTGPSLGKNIHHLKEAQSWAVIIAAGQALRPLLAYGVKPDFICSIDFGVNNMPHYAGLLATTDVPLVALCRTHAPLLRDYQGPVFVSGSKYSSPDYYLAKLWGSKGILNPGNSVAHLCFNLARLFEADPIIFVGQDLALEDTSHFDQADTCSQVQVTKEGHVVNQLSDPRHELNGYRADMGQVHQVPGYYGGKVTTQANLLSFLTLLEGMLEGESGRFINATEGGAKIKGTEQMRLVEAAAEFCAHPLDRSGLQKLTDPVEDSEHLISEVVCSLEKELELLAEVVSQAQRALVNNTEVSRLLERGSFDLKGGQSPLHSFLKKNARFSRETRDLVHQLPTMMFSVYGAQARIKHRDLDVADEPGDGENLRARTERNRLILQACHEAGLSLKDVYQESADILDRYPTLSETVKERPDDSGAWLALGRGLEEMGDWSGAAGACQRAVSLSPEDSDCWQTLARLALKRERFQELEEALGRLAGLPGGPGAAQALGRERDAFLDSLLEASEADFEVGNFARPLLYAQKYLAARPQDPQAQAIIAQAEEMRAERVAKAEAETEVFLEQMNGEKGRQLRYQELVARSRELGRSGDYEGALTCLEEAVELAPQEAEGRLGLATTFHHLDRIPEARIAFQKLVADFPDNPRFRFELGLVTIKSGQVHQGLNEIRTAMSQSDQFKTFLPKMGDLYRLLKQHPRALAAYDQFLDQFEADYETWTRKGDCLFEMGRFKEAADSYEQALRLKPDFQPALAGLARLSPGPSIKAGGSDRPLSPP